MKFFSDTKFFSERNPIVVGAIGTVSGGLLAGLIGAADETEG